MRMIKFIGTIRGEILVYLLNENKKQASCLKIAREIDCTYAGIMKSIDELTKFKLMTTKKKGRIRHLTLTPKGKMIAEGLRDFHEIVRKANI